ncbi:MAG: helix-turn-helix domain-containing protein, partial [Eubacterium sp.]|nr:helix-turn-helix domain-containing protein [Eubacterium sp.]
NIDIMNRSQQFHIEMRAKRVVFLIEINQEKDPVITETVRGLFTTGRDFITAVDEQGLTVVREISDEENEENLDRIAHTLVDMLESEALVSARVSYGTIVGNIKDVSRSYKEARLALDVGRIFYSDRKVVAYSNLGIGRLIYQLPLPLCKMFINEIFGSDKPITFDEEMLTTIDQFFANNLNVSKTSRELYIHRNTLVYRLDKLQKLTGLDIQTFDDAITFEIALMVMKYMKYLETIEY